MEKSSCGHPSEGTRACQGADGATGDRGATEEDGGDTEEPRLCCCVASRGGDLVASWSQEMLPSPSGRCLSGVRSVGMAEGTPCLSLTPRGGKTPHAGGDSQGEPGHGDGPSLGRFFHSARPWGRSSQGGLDPSRQKVPILLIPHLPKSQEIPPKTLPRAAGKKPSVCPAGLTDPRE